MIFIYILLCCGGVCRRSVVFSTRKDRGFTGRNAGIFFLPLGVAAIWGNWGTLASDCWGGDPCVAGLGGELSPIVISAYGNFPENGGERKRQVALSVALRRLVLRCRSAFGRRKTREGPVFPCLAWLFGTCCRVLITRRS